MSGGRVPPAHLHVTLLWLGDHDDMPHDLLRRAKGAAGRVEMAPFGVGFDRIGSFGDASMGGLALTGTAELKMLRQFQRTLATTVQAAGINPVARKQFKPHISLLYCKQRVAREEIAPIRWQVREFVLIESLVGQGKHIDLGTWPLQSRQMSFSDW